MKFMIPIILILLKNTLFIVALMSFSRGNLEIVSKLFIFLILFNALEKVYGLVIRTGFVTTKGALVRDILYPK
jgi:hypothetical protein